MQHANATSAAGDNPLGWQGRPIPANRPKAMLQKEQLFESLLAHHKFARDKCAEHIVILRAG